MVNPTFLPIDPNVLEDSCSRVSCLVYRRSGTGAGRGGSPICVETLRPGDTRICRAS